MVAGIAHCSPSAIFLMVPRRILPERVFGSRAHGDRELERRHGTELFAHQGHDLLLDFGVTPGDAGLQHQEAAGHLALDGVLDAEHRAFGDVGVAGEHFSMPPVESRWPATLMMSSVRPITKT